MEQATRRITQRDRATKQLAAHLIATGLSQTSLRQLALAADVSDRMLLYYFPDKAGALTAALSMVAADLAAILGEAIPADFRLAPGALIARAVTATADPRVRPYMALWIEIVAAAARGEAPYREVAGQIAGGFLDWVQSRLAGEPAETRGQALAILAMVDGVALIAACMGEDSAGEAGAAMLGLRFD